MPIPLIVAVATKAVPHIVKGAKVAGEALKKIRIKPWWEENIGAKRVATERKGYKEATEEVIKDWAKGKRGRYLEMMKKRAVTE